MNGDIIRFCRNKSKYRLADKYNFEIYYNNFLCHFALDLTCRNKGSYGKNGQFDIMTLSKSKAKDIEIIGNIHDNKELLE